jgi:murein DD-endopeptidase MepM/ murein hydrolase activator NlpD
MRIFVFSDSSLDFREVRFFRAKVLGSGLLIGLIALTATLLINHFANDFLGLGYNSLSVVTAENRMLKERVRVFSDKMEAIQQGLDQLHLRGNELRLLADLSRIDEDTRTAAVGGTKFPATNAFLTGEAGEILDNAQNLIEQLTREVRIQQASYSEIAGKFEYNKKFFAHLPAVKPMAGYYSINAYGMRIHPVLRVYRMHPGIDIANDTGTKIYATGDGVVRFAGRTNGGYGIAVEISHGYGFTTFYAHLSKVLVRRGEAVKRGEPIGLSGRSGLVTGPHLHYEVRLNGAKQNPVDYFFDDVDAARYRLQLAKAQ